MKLQEKMWVISASHEQTVFEETYLSPQIKNLDYIYEYHMVPH